MLIAYEDYMRLSRRDRRVDATAALNDDDLVAIEAAEMEAGLDDLNIELTLDKNAAD